MLSVFIIIKKKGKKGNKKLKESLSNKASMYHHAWHIVDA